MGTVFLGVCTIEPPKTVPHLTSPLKGEEQNARLRNEEVKVCWSLLMEKLVKLVTTQE